MPRDDVAAFLATLDPVVEGPIPITSCPFARHYRFELIALDKDEGTAELACELGEWSLHGGGVVQGGPIASVLDFAMAIPVLARCEDGQGLATLNLNVNFVRPLKPGRVTCGARITHMGRQTAVTSAVLYDSKDRKIATATASGMLIAIR